MLGMMGGNIKEIGSLGNNTGKVSFSRLKKGIGRKEPGVMGKELDGEMMRLRVRMIIESN